MEMNKNEQAALRLLAELQNLTQVAPTPAIAARLTIRSDTGEYLGEVALSVRAADEIANAVSAVAQYAETSPADYLAGRTPPPPADGTTIDPRLEAELEEHCVGLDTDYLMTVASLNPQQAVAEFDDITEDGGL